MKILFRVDASELIGTGHVMRCLTLANEAASRGWSICFATRCQKKSILRRIKDAGHKVELLSSTKNSLKVTRDTFLYSNWLTVSQEDDANETKQIFKEFCPNWIVVDHYAIDATWHRIIKSSCPNILVIDDLANRRLDCKILLDQNLGALQKNYKDVVSSSCKFLLGPRYALLRPEFRHWRKKSKERRATIKLKKILITMGGVDAENYTLAILRNLEQSEYSADCSFTVVIGTSYPYKTELNMFVGSTDLSISIMSNVNNMAEIMANSDLCIGAAGSTSWERCCLGLPTLTLAIAENQIKILAALKKNAVNFYSSLDNICYDFDKMLAKESIGMVKDLIRNSLMVCDGLGSSRVLNQLEEMNENCYT